jgi:AraC-like DNA-binding protein
MNAQSRDAALDLPFATLGFTGPPRLFYWDRDYHWAPPPLPDHDQRAILDGSGAVNLRGKRHDLRPGSCFVLQPGDCPNAKHDPANPLVAFYCHFNMHDRFGRKILPDQIELPPPGLPAEDPALLTSMARRCVSCYQRGDTLGQRQARLTFEQMLALLWQWWRIPPGRPGNAKIAEVIREIEAKPGLQWSVDSIAKRACLSRSQLTRRFKAHVGMGPMKLVIRARIELAKQLIMESDMTVSQVAAELGYTDIYFFSRQFKHVAGYPPSRARHARNMAIRRKDASR